ncbi:MAG: Ser/Thr protein kinase RdoA (MazF antagonist) [Paraglaciecola sp.]|jgi:Ser/Thr protein kinase RdoA (MazF antagonist)
MSEQVPNFNNESLAKILLDLYGLEGELSPLVSFEDQNARIKTATATYVLKIANTRWSREFMQMQTDVLGYLKTHAPKLAFPSIVPTLKGDNITYIDGFAIRLLTYLEGDLLTNTPRTPALYQDIGKFLGQFSKAMQTYSVTVAEGSDELWKLDNVMACKKYLPEVTDEDAKDRIERLYAVYEKNILPKLAHLRKAVIHGDANEQNLLVSSNQPMKIAGLIDFGEMQLASQINDLAIALAYSLLGENDIAMASSKIIEGYDREFKIADEEREIIYYLMAMRLVTNITMTSHSAKLFPDNEYILISQKPARALLKKLEEEKYILA